MRDMTDHNSGLFDDSRRSFMKKGALATTALALGASATTGSASAQENGNDEVLVYGDDYRPGVDFTVVSELSTSTQQEVFDESGAEEDIFDDPDDWDVFVINYDLGVEAPTWGMLFTEEADLSAGDSNTMGANGDFRDAELNLVEVDLGVVDEEEIEEEEEEEEIEEEEEEEEIEEEEEDDEIIDDEDEEDDNGF